MLRSDEAPRADYRIEQLRREKLGLLIAFGITAALLLFAIAFVLAVLVQPNQANALAATALTLNGILINLGCAIVFALLIAGTLKFFNFDDPPHKGGEEAAHRAGLVRLFEKWAHSKPNAQEFIKLFRDSATVQIYGVTVLSGFIGENEFPRLLRERLADPSKTTKILLVEPAGAEIARRYAMRPDRSAPDRARASQAQLRVLDTHPERTKHLRHFDYAPSFSMLRFDDVCFVNLLMFAKEDSSPGLQLHSSGWLFHHYAAEFDQAWTLAADHTKTTAEQTS